jgi:hypothetical protein
MLAPFEVPTPGAFCFSLFPLRLGNSLDSLSVILDAHTFRRALYVDADAHASNLYLHQPAAFHT